MNKITIENIKVFNELTTNFFLKNICPTNAKFSIRLVKLFIYNMCFNFFCDN